jgi:purine-binding chemotaxis protein CheW
MSLPPLPHSGLAKDVLEQIPPADPGDPQPLVSFVRAIGPAARAQMPAPEPVDHLVAFELQEELFTFPVRSVREIVRVHQLTRVPQAPPHVRGVQNLRGAVLPVLEVRTRIALAPAEITERSRVIVAEAQQRLVGLLVDAVVRVAAVRRSEIHPPPPEVRSQISEYVLGTAPVDGRTSLLLDLDGLLLLPGATSPENGR